MNEDIGNVYVVTNRPPNEEPICEYPKVFRNIPRSVKLYCGRPSKAFKSFGR